MDPKLGPESVTTHGHEVVASIEGGKCRLVSCWGCQRGSSDRLEEALRKHVPSRGETGRSQPRRPGCFGRGVDEIALVSPLTTEKTDIHVVVVTRF